MTLAEQGVGAVEFFGDDDFPADEAGHVGGGTVARVGGAPGGIGGAEVFVRRRHGVRYPFRWRSA